MCRLSEHVITIDKADTGVAAWVLGTAEVPKQSKASFFCHAKTFFRIGSARGDGRLSNPNIIKQMAQVLEGSDEN